MWEGLVYFIANSWLIYDVVTFDIEQRGRTYVDIHMHTHLQRKICRYLIGWKVAKSLTSTGLQGSSLIGESWAKTETKTLSFISSEKLDETCIS